MSTNPFPGLRPFDASENHLFFGRDGQSDDILTSLRRNRFVAVVGTSGSGKSSLIRAGLLPLLHGGFMAKASSTWRIAVMRPGNDPIGNLADALVQDDVLGARDEDPEISTIITETTLRRSGLGLIEAVRLARIPEKQNVLVVVDQFEELFRFMRNVTSAHAEDDLAFVKLILEATRQTEVPIFVVITMRSDFIGDCARFRELPETINRGLYLIPIMTRDQRREAIAGPAAVAGTQLEPRLVNRLLNDAGENPEQLPLLQHALMRTWASWDATPHDGVLNMESYEAIGGMEHALSRHADEAFAELRNDRERNIAEKMFKALAEKGPDNREVRRPTKVADIAAIAGATSAEVISVIEVFRQPGRSFLMPPPEVHLDEQSLIDISHESLIRGWKRLSEWVESEALSAAIYKRVAETAVLFDKGEAGLWHDPDLQVALGWQDKVDPNEAWGRRYHPGFPSAMNFLSKSVALRDQELFQKEEQRAREEAQRIRELRRTRRFAAVFAVLLVLASALGVWAMTQRTRANSEAARALTAYRDAENARKEAVVAKNEAVAAKEEAIRKRDEAEANKKLADEKTQEAEANLATARAARKAAEDAALAAAAANKRLVQEQAVSFARSRQFRDTALGAEKQNFTDMNQISFLSGRLIDVSSPNDALRWHTIKASALSNIGQHKEAAEEYTKVLDVAPDDLGARMSRGYMYMLTDRVPQSIDDFDRILAVDPRSSLAYLNRGISQGILGSYADASTSIKSAIDTFTPGLYGSLSENEVSPTILEATGKRSIAANETEFQTALHYQLANIEAFRGGTEFDHLMQSASQRTTSEAANFTAINWAWLHMNNRPADYGGLVSQGAAWERLGPGYCRQAIAAYQDFLATHDKQRDPRYNSLAVWARQRAKIPCNTPPLPKPENDPQAYVIQADYWSDKRDFDKAETLLTSALEKSPSDVALLIKRAQLRNWARKFPESKADAEEAIRLAGNKPVPRAYVYRGLASGDLGEREKDLRTALKDSPTDTDTMSFLSQLLEDKDVDEAIDLLDRATRYEPGNDGLLFRKATLQEKAGRNLDALRSVETAIAIKSNEPSYYDLRATIEKKLAKPPGVVTSNLVGGYNNIADLLLKRGESGEALDAYVKNLKTLAAAASEKGGESLHYDMVSTMHKIARLIEQQGASKEKVIAHLRVLFGDVKGLEAVLNEEVKRLSN